MAERKSKKRNIIIKGVNWEKKMTEQEVEKVIEEKLKFRVGINKVGEIKIREVDDSEIRQLGREKRNYEKEEGSRKGNRG